MTATGAVDGRPVQRLPSPSLVFGPRAIETPAAIRLLQPPRWHGGSSTRKANETEVRLWTASSWPVPGTNRAAGLEHSIAGDSPVIAGLLLPSCPAPPSAGSATPKRHPPSLPPPPRSLHRRELRHGNSNKNGVRLWTACSPNESTGALSRPARPHPAGAVLPSRRGPVQTKGPARSSRTDLTCEERSSVQFKPVVFRGYRFRRRSWSGCCLRRDQCSMTRIACQ